MPPAPSLSFNHSAQHPDVRRKFVDVQQSQGSAIAEETIKRIAMLYGVEKVARGCSPEERVAIRQKGSFA